MLWYVKYTYVLFSELAFVWNLLLPFVVLTIWALFGGFSDLFKTVSNTELFTRRVSTLHR